VYSSFDRENGSETIYQYVIKPSETVCQMHFICKENFFSTEMNYLLH